MRNKRLRVLIGIFLLNCYSLAAMAKPVYADKVLVMKAERMLYLYRDNKIIARYPISLGGNPLGHKKQQGDSRTPEGKYIIDYRNPASRFHLSLHISYPNKQDRSQARQKGLNPGGDIFIHGLPNGFGKDYLGVFERDWTDGCIAVSNAAIKLLWKSVKNGTPIEIRP